MSHVTRHFLGLPHRPPFVFVREVINCDPGRSVEATTSFAAEDPMFAGHFPGNPLVPGVIITEALAQTAGIAAASGYPENARPLFLLSAIRTMKFLQAIRPEEQVDLRVEKMGEMEGMVQFKVAARVKGIAVAEGQLVLSVAANFAPGPE
ncbi:MAG: 3-hydroxyacyl-[acyl-carrier-protein] dehydratase [Verrucomicrobiota bacterium]|jgi:3-hydroxyacyl-[acyl-carrier-protein] dehydratase